MKYEIEIEGLPEGWEPVAIRKQKLGEHIFCLDTGFVVPADHRTPKAHLIVKKKQPRRIVLEDTEERNSFIKIDGIPYRIIEDSGEKNGD